MSLLADGFITYFWDLRASKVNADGSDGASSTRAHGSTGSPDTFVGTP